MTRKEMIDYINNLNISIVLIYDMKKYTNRFFDKYFDLADLYKKGSYYNSQIDDFRACYIEFSTYLYALCRAGILHGNDFQELEEIIWTMYVSMEDK